MAAVSRVYPLTLPKYNFLRRMLERSTQGLWCHKSDHSWCSVGGLELIIQANLPFHPFSFPWQWRGKCKPKGDPKDAFIWKKLNGSCLSSKWKADTCPYWNILDSNSFPKRTGRGKVSECCPKHFCSGRSWSKTPDLKKQMLLYTTGGMNSVHLRFRSSWPSLCLMKTLEWWLAVRILLLEHNLCQSKLRAGELLSPTPNLQWFYWCYASQFFPSSLHLKSAEKFETKVSFEANPLSLISLCI